MQNGTIKVLVVDDTDITRELLAESLLESGYEVDEAASGEAAIERIKKSEGDFDFVIMDQVLLGGMDGIRAAHIIHQKYPLIRTIVMTMYGDGESSRAALDAGARYVFRSLVLAEAIDDIIAVIDSSRELSEIQESLLGSFWMNNVCKGMGMAISVVDRTYRVLYANDAQSQLAGGELRTGGICWVEFHQAFQQKGPCPWCPVKPLFEGENPVVKVVPLVRQGRVQYWQTSASPIVDSGGKIIAALKWGTDVTEREQAHVAALTAQSVDERLEAALNQIRMLSYSRARLYELSEDGETLMGRKQVGGMNAPITEIRLSVRDDPYSRITLSSRVPVIHQVGEHGDTLFDDEISRAWIEEWLDVPLWTGDGQLVGKISIDNKIIEPVRPDRPPTPRVITDEHFEPLLTIAGFAANAIWSEREYRRAVQESDLLRKLRALDADLAKVLEPREILREVVRACLELTGADSGNIRLQVGEKLTQTVRIGQFSAILAQELPMSQAHIPCVWVARTGERYVANQAQEDEHIVEWKSKTADESEFGVLKRLGSYVSYPLEVGGQTIGVLSLQSERPGFFTNQICSIIEDFRSRAAIAIENAQLFEETQRRIRDLEIVNRVGQTISAKLDVPDLLQTVVAQISDQLNCTHCTLFFVQEEYGEPVLVPQVTHGVPFEQIMTRRFKPGEGLAGWVFQQGESLVLADASQDRRFAPARRKQDQPRSMLVVPLKVGDQTIGVISADQDKFGWFDENGQRLVEALAAQAAIAIENARLFKRAEKQAQEMSTLFEVGKAIISSLKLDEVLKEVFRLTGQLIPFETALLFLSDRDSDELSVRESYGYDRAFIEKQRFTFRPGDGYTGWIAETQRPLLVEDTELHTDIQPKYRFIDIDRPLRSFIGVPLIARDRLVGVFEVTSDRPQAFSQEHLALLTALADQLAVAIEQARLFEETQSLLGQLTRRAQQLSGIGEVATRIQSTDDPAIMLHLALTGVTARQGLGFSRAMLFLVNDKGNRLEGEVAIGAMTQEEALKSWRGTEHYSLQGYLDAAEKWPPRSCKPLNQQVLEMSIPLTDTAGALARCIQERRAIYVPDAHNDPLTNRQLVERVHTDAFVAVPLMARGRGIGVLVVDNKYLPHSIMREDLDIVEAFAGQVAIAIENARLAKKRDETFGDIAHQLYSPLTSMKVPTDRLADGEVKDPDTVQEYYRIIATATEEFTHMVTDILNLRRIEARAFDLWRREVSVTDIIQKVVRLFRFSATAKDIEIETVLDHNVEYIQADEDKMTAALQALVENAIQFSEKGGRVSLSARNDGEAIYMSVRDEGYGIPEDELPRIFEKYYRGRITTEKAIEGVGIGLTIARHVVEQHGGRISVESNLGEGSTFTITLPLQNREGR